MTDEEVRVLRQSFWANTQGQPLQRLRINSAALFLDLFFTLFLFHEGEMVGSLSVKSEHIIEFIAARLPTLQILGEKKVIKMHEQTHTRLMPLSICGLSTAYRFYFHPA